MAKIKTNKINDYYYPLEIPYLVKEIRTGTWVDGKPLYRRGVPITVTELGKTATGNLGSVFYEDIINIKGIFKERSYTRPVPYIYSNSDTITEMVTAWVNGTTVNVLAPSLTNMNSWKLPFTVYITLEYTKK